MITCLLYNLSSPQTQVSTPHWSQGTRVPFFPQDPSTQAEAWQGGASDTRRRVRQVAAASGRAPRAAKPRAHIMDGELSGFAWLAVPSRTPEDQQDS